MSYAFWTLLVVTEVRLQASSGLNGITLNGQKYSAVPIFQKSGMKAAENHEAAGKKSHKIFQRVYAGSFLVSQSASFFKPSQFTVQV